MAQTVLIIRDDHCVHHIGHRDKLTGDGLTDWWFDRSVRFAIDPQYLLGVAARLGGEHARFGRRLVAINDVDTASVH